jgi:hypothetical protein
MIIVARFYVNVSDGLCAALDKACILTRSSRSRVLAVLIRVHIQHLIGFMDELPGKVDEDKEAVTVDELRGRGDAPVLDARTKDSPELNLLIRTLGLTNPPNC